LVEDKVQIWDTVLFWHVALKQMGESGTPLYEIMTN
jgi:hypothetical protein